MSQKIPDRARKNKNVRKFLFTELKKNFLTVCLMSRRLSSYFAVCVLAGSLNT